MIFLNYRKGISYKPLLVIIFISIASIIQTQNIIVDSSFEGHNSSGCDYNNTDASFNGHYSNVNAFAYNNTGEVDIMKSTSCIGENPPVGATHLGIAHNGDLDRWDQISMNLTTPIIAGATYDLSFWIDVVQYLTQQEGNLEFGISNSSTTFGTLFYTGTAPLSDPYVQITASVTAPVGGNYLTIRPQATGASNRCWIHLDGVELIGEALPFCDFANVNVDTMIMPLDTFSDYTLSSEDSIVLTGKILAGIGADTFVDLRASSAVILNAPFETELGTRTLIYIANCDGSMLTANDEDGDTPLLKTNSNTAIKENEVIRFERDFEGMTPPFR